MPRKQEKQFGQPRGNPGAVGQLGNEGYLPGILDIGQPDVSEVTFRALQLKGALPAHLDRQIQLGIQADDFTLPEFWWLRRGLLGTMMLSSAALAANVSWVAVRAPVGTLAVVDSVFILNNNAVASTVILGMRDIPPGAGTFGAAVSSRDARAGAGRCSVEGVATQSAGIATPFPSILVTLAPSEGREFRIPFVLANGWVLSVCQQAVNQSVVACFQWRERTMLSSEA